MLKTKVFNLKYHNHRNLSEMAKTMGISVSLIYRVRGGKRGINKSFIIGAIKSFLDCKKR